MPQDSDQASFTEPQSRIMKHSNGGFGHSYDAPRAVYAAHQIIVAAELTDCASDSGQLPEVAGDSGGDGTHVGGTAGAGPGRCWLSQRIF